MSTNQNAITRTVAREKAFQLVFGASEYADLNSEIENVFLEYKGHEKQARYVKKVVLGTIEHENELIEAIKSELGEKWSISRLSKMSIAILKLALYEIIFMEDIPNGTAINEAVNLSKKYGDDKEPAFINGLLGKYLKDMGL